MGRGKCWSREESEAVAKAWKRASAYITTLREQNTKRFAGELYRHFIEFAPKNDHTALDGRWTSRSQTAVKTQFDAIGDDILKFNVVMYNIMEQAARQAIETNDPRVLRASIAVHLGTMAATHVDFDNVETVETDWKLFESWRILKTCPRFASVTWPLSRTPNTHSPMDINPIKPSNSIAKQESHPNPTSMSAPPPPPSSLPSPAHVDSQPHSLNIPTNLSTQTHHLNNNYNSNPHLNHNNNHTNNNNRTPRDSTSHPMSVTDIPSHNVPSGNTPMRTLASAALSMPVPTATLPPAPIMADHSSGTLSPRRTPASGTTLLKPSMPSMPSMAALTGTNGPTPNGIGGSHLRMDGTRRLKRRLETEVVDDYEDDDDCDDDINQAAVHDMDDRNSNRTPKTKMARISPCELVASASAIQMVGQALRSLGDALSEYNAITLFSRPDMEGRQDSKVFFNALAEKHVLKAKMDRDKVARQKQRSKENGDQSRLTD